MKLFRQLGIISATLIIVVSMAMSLIGCPTESSGKDPVYGISLDVASIPFDAVTIPYAVPAARTVTITNTGDQATGELTVALSGAGAGSFTLSEDTVASIAVGANGSFTVVPNANLSADTYSATITVSNTNVAAKTVSVSITVNPQSANPDPTYDISLSQVTFPPVTIPYTPAAQTVTITNAGNQPTGQLDLALSGAGADSFELSTASVNTIAVNGTGTFTVAPKAGLSAATYTAAITVSNINIAAKTVPISITVNPQGTLPTPEYRISLSPATVSFPAATAGYTQPAPATVTITNTGDLETGALTATLGGTNAANFALTGASIGSIASGTTGNTATFTVVPNAGLAEGSYTATITVANANITANNTVNVSFTVGPVPPAPTYTFTLSPTPLSFGDVKMPYAPPEEKTVTITSTGNQATGTLTVTLSGTNAASFSLSGTTALSTTTVSSIGTGATGSFKVWPAASGLTANGTEPFIYTATVTVVSANNITNTLNVNITVSPQPVNGISLSPTTFTFDEGEYDYEPLDPVDVTVTNIGSATTASLTASLTAGDTGSFELAGASISAINSGATAAFTVKPKDTLTANRRTPRTYTATITVAGTNITENNTVTVNFTVKPGPSTPLVTDYIITGDLVQFSGYVEGFKVETTNDSSPGGRTIKYINASGAEVPISASMPAGVYKVTLDVATVTTVTPAWNAATLEIGAMTVRAETGQSKNNFVTVWADQQKSVTVSPETSAISRPSGSQVITANLSGVTGAVVKGWYVNGALQTTPAGAATYTFNATAGTRQGKHIVSVLISIAGQLYKADVTVTVN